MGREEEATTGAWREIQKMDLFERSSVFLGGVRIQGIHLAKTMLQWAVPSKGRESLTNIDWKTD